MQIIVVSSDFRSKRTLSVGIPQVIGLGFAGLVALALTATLAMLLGFGLWRRRQKREGM